MAISPAPMNVFMGMLIAAFLAKKIIAKERFFDKGAVNVLLVLFFFITCLSTINSINFKDSIKGGILRLLQYMFIFFALVQEVREKRQIKRIIFSAGLGLSLVSIDCIWQVFSGHDFIRGYAPVINIGLTRATASFKDSNTLGVYLSALFPLILGTGLFYFKSWKKIILSLVSGLSLLGIALTYSRPTLLAVYVSILLLAWARKAKLIIFSLVIILALSPFLVPKSVKDFAKSVDYNAMRFMCNDDRIAIFRNSLNMIRHHPVIGVGANTFMKNYKTYKESPEYRNVVTSDYIYAHNNFLHMTAELGFTGLAIFLCWLFFLFKLSLKTYKSISDNFLKVVALSLMVCLSAFIINGLTESSLYYSRVALIFWYLAGLSFAMVKFSDADKSGKY